MKKLSTCGLVLYNLLAIVAATALVEAGAFLYLAHLDAKTASVRDPRAAEFPPGMQKLTFAKTRLYRVHAPFRSADYNVDDYGFRGVSGVRDAFEAYDPSRFNIFAFGGSSTFGVGVKDGDTWPMILQAKLRRQLPGAAVFNLGLGGFSSADEMHLLVDLLAQNRTPAVAIFLDGGNEQCPAASDRSAAYRVLEYGLLAHVIQASNAVRLWHRVADKWRLMSEGAAGPVRPIDYKTCGAAYSAQARLVTRLLAAYGAKALFFLQPIGALLPNFDTYQFWSYSNSERADSRERVETVRRRLAERRCRPHGRSAHDHGWTRTRAQRPLRRPPAPRRGRQYDHRGRHFVQFAALYFRAARGSSAMRFFSAIWRYKAAWLPGVLLVVILLVIAVATGAMPELPFKYRF